jgi:hypothetical protein
VRRILNNRARKDTHVQVHKAMAVSLLVHGTEIQAVKKKRVKIKIAEMKLLRIVAGYTRMNQTISPKIRNRMFLI